MLKAKDYRAKAREALKGKWKHASIAGLIAGILGATILYQGYAGSSAQSATEGSLEGFSFELILATIGIFAVVGAVMILIGSLVGLGYAKFNLSLYEEETADFKKRLLAMYRQHLELISLMPENNEEKAEETEDVQIEEAVTEEVVEVAEEEIDFDEVSMAETKRIDLDV